MHKNVKTFSRSCGVAIIQMSSILLLCLLIFFPWVVIVLTPFLLLIFMVPAVFFLIFNLGEDEGEEINMNIDYDL